MLSIPSTKLNALKPYQCQRGTESTSGGVYLNETPISSLLSSLLVKRNWYFNSACQLILIQMSRWDESSPRTTYSSPFASRRAEDSLQCSFLYHRHLKVSEINLTLHVSWFRSTTYPIHPLKFDQGIKSTSSILTTAMFFHDQTTSTWLSWTNTAPWASVLFEFALWLGLGVLLWFGFFLTPNINSVHSCTRLNASHWTEHYHQVPPGTPGRLHHHTF